MVRGASWISTRWSIYRNRTSPSILGPCGKRTSSLATRTVLCAATTLFVPRWYENSFPCCGRTIQSANAIERSSFGKHSRHATRYPRRTAGELVAAIYIDRFIHPGGTWTATTSPCTHGVPSALTVTLTTILRPAESLTIPRSSSGTPSGVGRI